MFLKHVLVLESEVKYQPQVFYVYLCCLENFMLSLIYYLLVLKSFILSCVLPSCFANVVLQCLACTRPLVAYLLEKDHRRECKYVPLINMKSWNCFRSFYQILLINNCSILQFIVNSLFFFFYNFCYVL